MMLSRIALLMLLAVAPSIADAQDQSQDAQSQDNQSQGDQAQPAQTQPDQSGGQPQGSDQGQNANQAPSPPQQPADAVAALQGLWRVDKVDGSAGNDGLMGRMFRIDSAAITSMTAGTCSNPGFTAAPDSTNANKQTVTVTCVGQTFATAAWDATDPDTVDWSEPNLQVVLHRVASAATLKSGADGGNGADNNSSGNGDNNSGAGNSNDDSGSE